MNTNQANLPEDHSPMKYSQALFQELFEFAPDAMLIVDQAGQIVNCNAQTEILFGYQRGELLGRSIELLVPERFHEQHIHHREHYFATPVRRPMGKGLNLVGKRQSGREFPIDIMLGPLGTNEDGLVVAVVRDISERKEIEEQTERQMQHLSALRSIDLAITSSLDLRVTLDILLDKVSTALQVDAANVLLRQPSTHTLTFAAGRGFRTSALQHTHLMLGEGLAGQAALEQEIVAIPDLNMWMAENPQIALRLPQAENFIAYFSVPLIAKGQVVGVLEVWKRSQFEPSQDWLDFLEALAAQAAIAVDSAQMFSNLQRSKLELELAYDATIEGWGRALELRDFETEGHTRRVTQMTMRLAHAVGISDVELVHIRRGALLHDIGKVSIPDNILLKPDTLTDDELIAMRKHPQYAYDMLVPISYLRPALDIPLCHHERWDGSGYPRGLKREQIPLSARVFAVVDVYDALLSDRPYRRGWTKEKVRDYIRANSESHFDPQVVRMFMQLF